MEIRFFPISLLSLEHSIQKLYNPIYFPFSLKFFIINTTRSRSFQILHPTPPLFYKLFQRFLVQPTIRHQKIMKLILRETQWCVKYLLCPIVCHLLNLYKWSNQLIHFIDSRNCRSYGNDISLRDFNLKWKMFFWKMKDIKKKMSWWQFIELMAIHQIPKYLTKNGNYFLFFIYSKHFKIDVTLYFTFIAFFQKMIAVTSLIKKQHATVFFYQ